MSALFSTTSRKVTAIVVAVVLVLLGAFLGTFTYYQAHALPRTQVGATDISGMTRAAALEMVESGFGDPEVTVNAPAGQVKTRLSDAGVSLDAQATVDQIFSAHASPMAVIGGLTRASSFPMQMSVDEAKLGQFASTLPLEDEVLPRDAKVIFDTDHFQVTPAESGKAIDSENLKQALVKAAQERATEVTVDTVTADPAVSTEMAETAAQQAGKWLETAITVGDGDAMQTSADIAVKGSWVSFERQDDQLIPVVNDAAVKTWVEEYAKTTNITPGVGIRNTDEAGTVVATVIEPTVGWLANNAAAVSESIVRAFPAGETVDAKFEYDEKLGDWTERRADPATEGMSYRAAPGEKWIGISIGGATVTTYEGATVLATYPVVAGKPSTPTIEGEYNVYLKYEVQDMGCTAEWSYCAKDVPWVSYFTGSYALHGSSSWQSGFGDPATRLVRGSAGCVNMRNEDALAVYEWADMGTKVISHG